MSDDTNKDAPDSNPEQTIEELSDKQLDNVAGGVSATRVQITQEQWEKLAATNDFSK